MNLEYHVISTLVENKPGVLQKVAGLFNRRGFNIDSITVGESEVEGLSRMVISVHADKKGLEQVTKQLNKLVDVIKIKDITKNAVKKELCLIKVNIPNAKARENSKKPRKNLKKLNFRNPTFCFSAQPVSEKLILHKLLQKALRSPLQSQTLQRLPRQATSART